MTSILNYMYNFMTESETVFENYCLTLDIVCKEIPTEKNAKTPDYELTINNQKIIAEVKGIELNPDEKKSEELIAKTRVGNVISNTPGDRVRKKINDSRKQIKAKTNGIYPGLLVLYDSGLSYNHLDSYNIRAAMCGLEQLHISVPYNPNNPPFPAAKSFGSNQKFTENDNTSISGIGVLWKDHSDIKLDIYHNKFAKIPLDPNLLRNYPIKQFKLGNGPAGQIAEWEIIDLSHNQER